MTKIEALALVKVADIGERIAKELGLIQNTQTAVKAIRLVNEAATRSKAKV
jgi:hypothetical protein